MGKSERTGSRSAEQQKLCLDRRRPSVPVPLNPRQSRVVGMERPADPIRSAPNCDDHRPRFNRYLCASRRKQRPPPPFFLRTVPRKLKIPRRRRSLSVPLGCRPERRAAEPAAVGRRSHGEQRAVTYFGSNAGDDIHALAAFIRRCAGTSPPERGTRVWW